MKTKLVKLTAREAAVIYNMVSIARAGDGDGDYASFKKADWTALDTLIQKLNEAPNVSDGKHVARFLAVDGLKRE